MGYRSTIELQKYLFYLKFVVNGVSFILEIKLKIQ